jgi:anti-anti-sigma regulatory factor
MVSHAGGDQFEVPDPSIADQNLPGSAEPRVFVPGAPELDEVELSADERHRYTMLVEWSYADEIFAAEPEVDQDRATLVLRGEVDAVALAEVRSSLELIQDARPSTLVVDLSGAAFVSVSAMLCVVDAAKHIPVVAIAHASPTARRIFELVDTDSLVNVID